MLEIEDIKISFGRFGMEGVNLSVASDDYFVLLGPSGAGKSVLLEIIAGLTSPDSGEIRLNGKELTQLPPHKRKVGLIFQHPAVFPHMSVLKNILYPMKGIPKDEKYAKAKALAVQMGIEHLLDSGTAKLSGGELQRVALARVLASEPDLLLLDEPLSAIDSNLRVELRGLLRSLNKRGLPVLHVTHDYEEAISLATTLAVIENGEIIQQGRPEEVFAKPACEFIAAFAGEHNFFKAKINGGKISPLHFPEIIITGPEGIADGNAYVLIRSRHVVLTNQNPQLSTLNNFYGPVISVNPLRDGFEVEVGGSMPFFARITRESLEKLSIYPGKNLWACFKASSVEVIY